MCEAHMAKTANMCCEQLYIYIYIELIDIRAQHSISAPACQIVYTAKCADDNNYNYIRVYIQPAAYVARVSSLVGLCQFRHEPHARSQTIGAETKFAYIDGARAWCGGASTCVRGLLAEKVDDIYL